MDKEQLRKLEVYQDNPERKSHRQTGFGRAAHSAQDNKKKKKLDAEELREKFSKMSEQEFWDLEKNI